MSNRENTTSTDNLPTAELFKAALLAPEEDEDYRKERWHFISSLQFRRDREVLDRSIALTKSPIPEKRSIGINILGQLGCPERVFQDECVTTLIQLLESECDPLILGDICIALGHQKDPRAIEPLQKFCLHPDWEVRYGVVSGLSRHPDDRLYPALLHLQTWYPRTSDLEDAISACSPT